LATLDAGAGRTTVAVVGEGPALRRDTLSHQLPGPTRRSSGRRSDTADPIEGNSNMVRNSSRLGFVAPQRAPNQEIAPVDTGREPAP